MAPKQKKAPAKKAKAAEATVTVKNTECGLTKAPFEEESWRACVSMIVGSGADEEALTCCLIPAVQQPICEHFTLLSWDGVLQKLREFGNLKAKKVESLPPFYEHSAVAESANALLDAGQEIPCELLAKVVKCLLLQLKRHHQQGSDKKAEENAEDTEKVEKKTKLKRRGEVEIPTVTDAPEDGPQLYVLLCGFYQPLLIAALEAVAVHVSAVVRLCVEVSEEGECGEHVQSQPAANVELARKLELFWSELAPVLNSGSKGSRLPDVAQLSYTVQTHSPDTQLETGIRIYGGVAKLLYDCLEWRRQHQHYLSNIRLVEVPAVARFPPQLAEVAPVTPRSKKKADSEDPAPQLKTEEPFLSADVDMRYYGNLMDRVPPESCSVLLLLHCMLEQVVVSTEQPSSELLQPPDGSWLDDPVTSFLLQRFLRVSGSEEEQNEVLEVLNPQLSAAERKKLQKAQKKRDQPLLIRHHDETAWRFRDIKAADDFDPVHVERSMARLHPACSLIQLRGQRSQSAAWSSIRQHLQHHCTGDADAAASWREVKHFFHQSVFESMPLTRLDQDGVLQRGSSFRVSLEPAQQHQEAAVLPWDDPPSFASLQLQNKQTPGQTVAPEDPGNTEVLLPSTPRPCVSRVELPPRGRRGTLPRLELADIQSCRLRSLSDWCFTERHDAAVLSQVLQSAWDESCCVDVFAGRLNDIGYVFCHNPTGPHRHSKEFWDAGLHTDVRFRNYLEHVAASVSDWMREEELKREAKVRDSRPADDPQDLQTQLETEELIIREGSLKAWKLEQERLMEEEERTRKMKNAPKGKQQQQQQEVVKLTDTTNSSSLSAAQKRGPEPAPETAPPVEDSRDLHPGEETFRGFIGFSTGGKLIRVYGRQQHLYPSDGGVVAVENIRHAEASQLLKVVVKKDGHRFCTHVNCDVTNRMKAESPEQQSKESLVRREVKQGSFTAMLHSGVQMSYSSYGPTGEPSGDVPETTNPFPSRADVDLPSPETHSDTRPPQPQGFQNVQSFSLSAPSGLLVQFQRDVSPGGSSQQPAMSLKQCFPLHGAGTAARLPDGSLSEEKFRIITSTGDVIRHLQDGSTQALFADGSVRSSSDSGLVPVPDSEVLESGEEPDEEAGGPAAAAHRWRWTITSPGGERTHTVGSKHTRLPERDLLVVKATDPMTGDVMLTREDLVVLVQKSDGSQAVEHADGTRISSWYQDSPTDIPSALAEPPDTDRTAPPDHGSAPRNQFKDVSQPRNHGTAQRSRERLVSVEKEGFATVLMFPERHVAQVEFADGSVIRGNSQGTYQVFPSNGGQLTIDGGGTCVYLPVRPCPAGGATPQAGAYRMSHTDRVACDITDPDGNHFQVLDNGDSSVTLASLNQEEHLPRLFLVHADGSGVELLPSQVVEEELLLARSDPAVALLTEPLPDSPGEFGITVLKPRHPSVWSQWMMGKQVPDVTPPNLRNRSWADFPQTENKTPGPGGSRAQQQPFRSCPDVMEVRQLYQHRLLDPALRDALDTRVKEYMETLMEREQRLEEVQDPQDQEDLLQALTEDVFARTASDVVSLYHQGVGAPEEQNLSEDASSDSRVAQKKFRWAERLRRHRQEVAEEKRLRAALRNKSCVPYFHPENLSLYQNLLQPPEPGVRSPSEDPSPVLSSDASDVPLPETPPQSSPPPFSPAPPPSACGATGSGRRPERLYVGVQASVGALKVSSQLHDSACESVTRKPRRAKVQTPASVSRSPSHAPNQQLLSGAGPVRRACRLGSLRSFQLFPTRVDFGALPEGGSASVTVRMTNVGVSFCRFCVEQPPLKTGLRVLYSSGPVAAGLHVDLQVQLFARAVGQSEESQTQLHHDLLIQTELESLTLPVTANILRRQEDTPV